MKGFGVNNETMISIGTTFNSCTDKDWNEQDIWLMNRLYFSMKTDGGVNFIAAIEPKNNTLTMLPMGNKNLISLHDESPLLLSDEFKDKLKEYSEPNTTWIPTKPEEMKDLRSKFPLVYLKQATDIGLYGENWKIVSKNEDDGSEKIQSQFTPKGTRLVYCGSPIDYLEAFANNISCYRTSKNSFNMNCAKIYSTDPNEVALKHLNLDEWCEKGDWSLWKKFFENRNIKGDKLDLIMGLIWAIYDESYKSRQMIYLYDPHGYCGKSVMLDALSVPFRKIDAYGVYTESNTNNFTNERLWDKRFLAMPDNKNPKIVKYGRFHQFTGDDPIDVDIKNKRGFTVKPQAKIFGVGNILPEVDLDARHEVSRIAIFCITLSDEANNEIFHKDGTKGDPTFGDKLKAQLKAFLYECREVAQKINKLKGDFNTDCLMEDLAKCEQPELTFFNKFISENIVFNGIVSRASLAERFESYKQVNIKGWSALGKPDFSNLEEHLRKMNNVEYKRHGSGMCFKGISLKDSTNNAEPQPIESSFKNRFSKKEINEDVEL